MSKGLPVKQSIFQFVDRGNEEYTYDIMCKVERGEVSLQEAKQKYRMILDKRKAKINTAKRLSTIEGKTCVYIPMNTYYKPVNSIDTGTITPGKI